MVESRVSFVGSHIILSKYPPHARLFGLLQKFRGLGCLEIYAQTTWISTGQIPQGFHKP